MDYDVFISYSRKDTAIADRVCAAFDKAGISYFIDRQGIGGGMEFPRVLAEAIVGCRKFLFLASANSYVSKFTNSEITFAFNKKSKDSILPYRIDRSEIPIELEFVFCNINWRNIEEHPVETVLVRDILQMLGRPTPSPSVPRISESSPEPARRPAPQPARTYKVGDYYNENGREGVVFEVDATGRHGKIVGMKQTKCAWAVDKWYGLLLTNPSNSKVGACDKHDGMKNMRIVMAVYNWREKYSAFAWCAALGDGWYLPAIEELKKFTLDDSIRDAVNRTLSQHGGDALFNKGDEYKWYWSSSEEYSKLFKKWCACYVYMGNGDTYDGSKNGNHYVRAVSAF